MVEVKADALEQSFDALDDEEQDGVAELKAELELLKAKIASGVARSNAASVTVIATVTGLSKACS